MVSNIDRMTNDDTVGRFRKNKSNCLIDLPGIYNLSHPIDEEIVVAHEMFHEQFNKIVNIIAAPSINRDLFLTIQLIETGKLSTVAINMADELGDKVINLKKMKQYLNGVDVILTQANRNVGMDKVEKSVNKSKSISPILNIYPKHIEELIQKISPYIPNRSISPRFYALMLLENNQFVKLALEKYYINAYKKIQLILKNANLKSIIHEISEARKSFIEKILKDCVHTSHHHIIKNNFRDHKVDRYLLKK
jgi:ferrous iron transport protein B